MLFSTLKRLAFRTAPVVVGCAIAACIGLNFTESCRANEHDSSYSLALESIRTDQIKSHVDYLADDRREGREAGSPGGLASGDYVADHFAQFGLEPAGDGGKFFQPFLLGHRNVLAVLPGSDPKLGHEIIIIGAHYDHVGRGTPRNSRGRPGEIHNGADDNASGTAGMLELAEAFSMLAQRPKRTILFVGWDAEEKGMLGSKHWVSHPTLPLENVRFVLNMDMIGRLRDNTVQVLGTRSGFGLRRILSEHNPGFDVVFEWTTGPNADHWPFFDHAIPFVTLHTGKHTEYHTQNDDASLIDNDGIHRLMRFMFATIYDMADAPNAPGFRSAARHETNGMRRLLVTPDSPLGPRLGIQWRESPDPDGGLQVTSIHQGSPAAVAQLQPGDRIVKLDGSDIRNGDELRWAVFHASGPVRLVVYRPNETEPREILAKLPRQQLRVGITWRVDPASPGTVVLTQVVPGSPAAMAGLNEGDRIYQVDGQDFSDEDDFARRLKKTEGPIEVLIERHGRLETVILRFDAVVLARAA